MNIILDLLLILVAVFFVWRGIRIGFMRAVISLVGTVLAFLIAVSFGGLLAEGIYEVAVKPSIKSMVEDKIKENFDPQNDSDASASAAMHPILNSLKNYEDFITKNTGSTKEDNLKTIANILNEQGRGNFDSGAAANKIVDTFAKPLLVRIISTISVSILFVVLLFVVRIISKMIRNAFNIPVLSTADKALGGALGLLKGVLAVFAVVIIIGTAVNSMSSDKWIVNQEVINKTTVFKALNDKNPLLK